LSDIDLRTLATEPDFDIYAKLFIPIPYYSSFG
jgi:hypothetical protein